MSVLTLGHGLFCTAVLEGMVVQGKEVSGEFMLLVILLQRGAGGFGMILEVYLTLLRFIDIMTYI